MELIRILGTQKKILRVSEGVSDEHESEGVSDERKRRSVNLTLKNPKNKAFEKKILQAVPLLRSHLNLLPTGAPPPDPIGLS